MMSSLNVYVNRGNTKSRFVVQCNDAPDSYGNYSAKIYNDNLRSIGYTIAESPDDCVENCRRFLEQKFGEISEVGPSRVPSYLSEQLLKDSEAGTLSLI